MGEQEAWRESAFEIYRLAWAGLDEWRRLNREDLEYWVEELREALLDLKQATIGHDEAAAMAVVTEVNLLMAELILRTGGDHG